MPDNTQSAWDTETYLAMASRLKRWSIEAEEKEAQVVLLKLAARGAKEAHKLAEAKLRKSLQEFGEDIPQEGELAALTLLAQELARLDEERGKAVSEHRLASIRLVGLRTRLNSALATYGRPLPLFDRETQQG